MPEHILRNMMQYVPIPDTKVNWTEKNVRITINWYNVL